MDYQKKTSHHNSDTQQAEIEHDRQVIEKSFAQFETNCTVSEEAMKKEFGKYGWGCKLD